MEGHRDWIILGMYWDNGKYNGNCYLGFGVYLEGRGDLVRRLINRITRVTIWVTRIVNLLTNSP